MILSLFVALTGTLISLMSANARDKGASPEGGAADDTRGFYGIMTIGIRSYSIEQHRIL